MATASERLGTARAAVSSAASREMSAVGGRPAIASPGAGPGPSVAMARPTERRGAPRVAVGLPASLTRGGARSVAVVRDASRLGLLVHLTEPLLACRGEVMVEVALPATGGRRLPATPVRAEVGGDGDVVMALRLLVTPREPATEGPPWGQPELDHPPSERARPHSVVVADVRALGGAAYELALLDPEAEVPEHLARWLASLEREIGATPGCPVPRTPDGLIAAVRSLRA